MLEFFVTLLTPATEHDDAKVVGKIGGIEWELIYLVGR
jgi:hypothetical protein